MRKMNEGLKCNEALAFEVRVRREDAVKLRSLKEEVNIEPA